MSRLEIAGTAVKDCFGSLALWVIQFFGNLALFVLFAAWLQVPVANGLYLILNFILIFVLLVVAFTLHCGTLNFFADRQRGGSAALLHSLRRAFLHILAIVVCVVAFYLLWLLVNAMASSQSTLPAYIRSILPAFLRRLVSLPTLDFLFAGAIFVLRWILVPGLLLPLILQAADRGFRGFNRDGFSAWKKSVASFGYWLLLVAAALLGVLATQAIMDWKPDFKTSTFSGEALSLAARLSCSYLFGLFAWILVCSSVGRHGAARTSQDVPGNSAA